MGDRKNSQIPKTSLSYRFWQSAEAIFASLPSSSLCGMIKKTPSDREALVYASPLKIAIILDSPRPNRLERPDFLEFCASFHAPYRV
jgi:hypothetical protein